jgi:hypothetical protein
MVKIYIGSPYTIGDKEENVRLQIDAAEELLIRGYAPYVPLLTHFQEIIYKSGRNWLPLDFEYLGICDVFIRLKPIKDGAEIPSKGADEEEQFARKHNIPMFSFNTIDEMCKYLDDNPFSE